MTHNSIAPVAIGLGVGIAFVIMFSVVMPKSDPPIQEPLAAELPQIRLVVTDTSHQNEQSYAGERGTYCWQGFGCADTSIIIPTNSISIAKGSIIQFAFIDSYHDNRPADDLGVFAFDLNRDLGVIGATEGRIGGDVQIATFDYNKPLPYLSDIGNRTYTLDLVEGEYIIWASALWYLDRDQAIGDGDVNFYYRISIS